MSPFDLRSLVSGSVLRAYWFLFSRILNLVSCFTNVLYTHSLCASKMIVSKNVFYFSMNAVWSDFWTCVLFCQRNGTRISNVFRMTRTYMTYESFYPGILQILVCPLYLLFYEMLLQKMERISSACCHFLWERSFFSCRIDVFQVRMICVLVVLVVWTWAFLCIWGGLFYLLILFFFDGRCNTLLFVTPCLELVFRLT